MKPHNPKSEVKLKPCEEATPWESLGVLPWTSLGRCTAAMQGKGRVTECLGGMTAEETGPREHWERQLLPSLPLKRVAAPVTAEYSVFSAPTESFLTLLLPPLFTLWSKREVLGRQLACRNKCLPFRSQPFYFLASHTWIKISNQPQKLLKPSNNWTDLLQPSWAPCKADPSLQAPLKEWEESHAADTLWGLTTLIPRYITLHRGEGV